MRGTTLFGGAAVLALAAGSAFGQTTVASQNFNALDDSGTFTSDSFPIGSVDQPLTNSGSFNSGGAGLDFATSWTDTNGNAGPLDPSTEGSGDFIGVNSFAGSNSPDVGPTGAAVLSGSEHNFEFNDADGQLNLVFEAVDMGIYTTNATVSFNYWFNDTGYEVGDYFTATLGDGVNSLSLANWDDVAIEARVSADDGSNNWGLVSVGSLESSGLDLSNLILTFNVAQNSGTENMFIDEVKFTGVPAPGAVALLGMGGLVAARRRRA